MYCVIKYPECRNSQMWIDTAGCEHLFPTELLTENNNVWALAMWFHQSLIQGRGWGAHNASLVLRNFRGTLSIHLFSCIFDLFYQGLTVFFICHRLCCDDCRTSCSRLNLDIMTSFLFIWENCIRGCTEKYGDGTEKPMYIFSN